MWFEDGQSDSKRRKYNRRANVGRQPILLVNARLGEHRRDRMSRAGAITMMVIAIAGAIWVFMLGARYLGEKLFSQNDQFVIRNLDLSSDGKLRPPHIREYGHIEEGMNLFDVDIQKVRKDLESVPVVSSVEVHRKLPDTLVVRIVERIAIARLGQDDGGYHLAVDKEGYVLGPSSLSPGLPSILGVKDRGLRPGSRLADANVDDGLAMIELCDSAHLSRLVKIKSVDVGNPEYLDVRLMQGERVLLSRIDVEAKLQRLASIIKTSAEKGQKIAAVDLTMDKNFPVQYR